MTINEQPNRRFLRDLFAGPFRGHAIIMDHEAAPRDWSQGDVVISERPVKEWLPAVVQDFETRLKWHNALGDDAVPYVNIQTGTEIFAAAFGCPVHMYDDAPPCALPLVTTADDAGRLPVPGLDARPLARVFELAELVRGEVGADVPISVPDIQSPFDIAALVWRKEDLFAAMYERPGAVKRLVDKCHRLLVDFLFEFRRRFPNCNLCHCPNAWAPPELGAWLSEDEAGSLSTAMFEEFCLPSLVELSERFGGLFVHCCAAADHQYDSFRKIPNLRGLNRVFQAPGPRPAIEAFSGRTVLMVAWTGEQGVCEMLDMALPDTRFLFNMGAQPVDEARSTFERLRARSPRR